MQDSRHFSGSGSGTERWRRWESNPRAVPAALAAAVAVALPAPADAGCNTDRCEARVAHRKAKRKKLRVVRPYRPWLGRVGACESGTGSHSLRVGLRAVNPTGKYRGRYQFDLRSWAGAGGRGDPIHAGWLEQAYRAVVWLRIAGPGAWPVCGR